MFNMNFHHLNRKYLKESKQKAEYVPFNEHQLWLGTLYCYALFKVQAFGAPSYWELWIAGSPRQLLAW